MIHIGLCADDKFALSLGVSITSIFETNKANDVFVHVLTKGLSQVNIAKLNETSERYNQHIDIHLIEDTIFDGFPISKLFPKAIYFRYLFADILPKDIKKILYIDCDTIVLQSVADLYNVDITDSPIAAVEDRNGDDILDRNRIEIYDGNYFNSGVLLINLDYWRDNESFKQLSKFIIDNPSKCLWPDQDALNIIFHKEVVWLPFKYNFLISFFDPFDSYRLHKKKWASILDSSNYIVILHYATKEKPWYNDSKHPLTFIWRYFYNKSVWNSVTLKNNRSLTDILYTIYKTKVLKWPMYTINPLMKDVIEKLRQDYTLKN